MSIQLDKKSFILYKDSLNVLLEMTDEEAGEFIKAIYYYQINGELPQLNSGMKWAINPFINQFIRDDEDWIDKKNKASQAGRASANARQQKQHPSTAVESVEQDATDSTVNVTVTVTANDTANDTVKKQNNASDDAMLVVDYFNQVNQTTNTGAKTVLDGLNKILKEYSIDDVKLVIDFMADSWYSENGQNTLSVLAKATKFYEKLEKAQAWERNRPDEVNYLAGIDEAIEYQLKQMALKDGK